MVRAIALVLVLMAKHYGAQSPKSKAYRRPSSGRILVGAPKGPRSRVGASSANRCKERKGLQKPGGNHRHGVGEEQNTGQHQ